MAEQLLAEIDWFPAGSSPEPPMVDCLSLATPGSRASRAPTCSHSMPTTCCTRPDYGGCSTTSPHASDVVATYGILERFDTTGSVGSPAIFRGIRTCWCTGLHRRDGVVPPVAWLELGGYPTVDRLYGWEDHDLWLSIAERGLRADLVRSIIGRRREQPGSMRKISDVDMASNFVTLRERHPRLPWPS